MHFTRLRPWAQAIIILAVGLVLSWGMWMALRDTFCTLKTEELLLKRPIRGACFEFWLNRYQSAWTSVISASVALFAAFLAWTAVNKQIKRQDDANRISTMAYWQAQFDNSHGAIISLAFCRRRLEEIEEINNILGGGPFGFIKVFRAVQRRNSLHIPVGNYSSDQIVSRVSGLLGQIGILVSQLPAEFDEENPPRQVRDTEEWLNSSFSDLELLRIHCEPALKIQKQTNQKAADALSALELR